MKWLTVLLAADFVGIHWWRSLGIVGLCQTKRLQRSCWNSAWGKTDRMVFRVFSVISLVRLWSLNPCIVLSKLGKKKQTPRSWISLTVFLGLVNIVSDSVGTVHVVRLPEILTMIVWAQNSCTADVTNSLFCDKAWHNPKTWRSHVLNKLDALSNGTNNIEKPWVLNSALTVLRLQQLNDVISSDSVSVVAWTRWFVSVWGSVPFLLYSWEQCSQGYLWFSVLWQPVCWWPPAGVPDMSDQSPCRLARWTEPFVLKREGCVCVYVCVCVCVCVCGGGGEVDV